GDVLATRYEWRIEHVGARRGEALHPVEGDAERIRMAEDEGLAARREHDAGAVVIERPPGGADALDREPGVVQLPAGIHVLDRQPGEAGADGKRDVGEEVLRIVGEAVEE